MAKYDREYFYKLVKNDRERDLLTNTFEKEQFKREFSSYTITEEDLYRPDLISIKVYRKLDYWWILMKVNKIEDIWNDLYVGKELKVPNILDIEDYYMNNRRKK